MSDSNIKILSFDDWRVYTCGVEKGIVTWLYHNCRSYSKNITVGAFIYDKCVDCNAPVPLDIKTLLHMSFNYAEFQRAPRSFSSRYFNEYILADGFHKEWRTDPPKSKIMYPNKP